MIYFDNAATTYPKPKCVIDEVVRCLKKYCGNPGRSSHKLAIDAAEKIYETREALAEFIGVSKCEHIIFTPNATYALNMVIKGSITEKCHCIVSDLEHNSSLRPLYKTAKEYDLEISFFNSNLPLKESIIPLIRTDTKFIIATVQSNVTGVIINPLELSKICKQYDLKLILDASQYLGHNNINMSEIDCYALCSAGHKGLYGIQGSGFAIINSDDAIDTLTEGGSGIDTFNKEMPYFPPERYEAGTLSTPSIASLLAGVKYIESCGIEHIHNKINKLTNICEQMLLSLPKVTIYGASAGIISFNIADFPSSYVADFLSKNNIATRSGFHCAPLIHKKLGTEKQGAVRVSLSHLNTEAEISILYKSLKDLLNTK